MAVRRTWLWIIGGVCGAGVLSLVAVAGAGIYFVSSHVQTLEAPGGSALEAFDAVTTSFSGRRALFELDSQERPHATADIAQLPAGATRPTALMVQAWSPDDQRLVRVTVPFWMLRLAGPQHIRARHDDGFDFTELNLDVAQLERIGPALVLDYRNQDGVRVLLWTK